MNRENCAAHLSATETSTQLIGMRAATRRLAAVNSHLTRHLNHTVPRPDYHQLNPTYFLPRAAAIEPNARAIVHKDRRGTIFYRSYQEFADRVKALAYYFRDQGKSRIAILSPNTPAHLETTFAATAAGGITMGLNYRLSAEEINYKIDLGQADLVMADEEFANLVDTTKHEILVDTDGEGESPYENAIQEYLKKPDLTWDGLFAEHIDENSTMGLFFTSGTTGRPKAVEFSHRNVYLCALANVVESNLNREQLTVDDESDTHERCVYLWTLPMFHAAGWTYPYAVTAARGTHICLRKVDTEYIWYLLKKYKVTNFCAAPTVNSMLLNDPHAERLQQAVRVTVAAAPPSPKLFEEMVAHNLFPVHMYGLTETMGPCTRCYVLEDWKKAGESKYQLMARQGHGFATCSEVIVVDENDVPIPKDGVTLGEVCIRGNVVTSGYHRNPTATAEAFKGGWFHSGDLAVWHSDGSIQIRDRKKDIIISGGENISSVFVESNVAQYPGILEVAIIGVPHDHYGEVPFAIVTLKGEQNVKDFSVEDLYKFLKDKIGGYQVPKKIAIVESLPKTSTGKVRKNVLRNQYQKNPNVFGKVYDFEK